MTSKQKRGRKNTTSKTSPKKEKKKETRRSRNPLAALDPGLNLKRRAEKLDYDYLNKLTKEELLYLAKFSEEWIHANLDHDHKGKKLHVTKEERSKVWKMNNDSNADIYTKQKAGGALKYIEDIKEKLVIESYEDQLIDDIDYFNSLKEDPTEES